MQAQDEAGQGTQAPAAAPPKPAKPAKPAPGSRNGRVNIAGWFPANVKFQLEELRLERSRKAGRMISLQDMQAEAYNDLFKKYGRPELAPVAAQ